MMPPRNFESCSNRAQRTPAMSFTNRSLRRPIGHQASSDIWRRISSTSRRVQVVPTALSRRVCCTKRSSIARPSTAAVLRGHVTALLRRRWLRGAEDGFAPQLKKYERNGMGSDLTEIHNCFPHPFTEPVRPCDLICMRHGRV